LSAPISAAVGVAVGKVWSPFFLCTSKNQLQALRSIFLGRRSVALSLGAGDPVGITRERTDQLSRWAVAGQVWSPFFFLRVNARSAERQSV
jgi:hypothetical protein